MSEKLVLNKRSVSADNSLTAYSCRCTCSYCDCSCSCNPQASNSAGVSSVFNGSSIQNASFAPTVSMMMDAQFG